MGANLSKKPFGATDPKTIQVPFGHVPYSTSLPGAMSQQWKFPTEWGFFAGWAKDGSGNEYSIILLSLRNMIAGGLMYGIGMKPADGSETSFHTGTHLIGEITAPEATVDSWSSKITTADLDRFATLKYKLSDSTGSLGLAGSKYEVDFSHFVSKELSVNLKLESTIGLTLQGSAGAFPGINMMQYGMPALSVQSGSSITIKGQKTEFTEGTFWYGRQCLMFMNPTEPVYIGTWFAVMMNDGTSYTLTFYWPKQEAKGTQWIVGTDLGSEYAPVDQTAVEYPAIKNHTGTSPIQGAKILDNIEYNCNILNPSDPENSPHWPLQGEEPPNYDGYTYCTAWNLVLKGKNYTVEAIVPQAQVKLMTYMYEAAANIYDNGELVGHAFVEQMGFN